MLYLELEEVTKWITKTEKTQLHFKQLVLEAEGGENVLDIISRYVLNQGMNEKIKNLRSEFYSKMEFKTLEASLVKVTNFE